MSYRPRSESVSAAFSHMVRTRAGQARRTMIMHR